MDFGPEDPALPNELQKELGLSPANHPNMQQHQEFLDSAFVAEEERLHKHRASIEEFRQFTSSGSSRVVYVTRALQVLATSLALLFVVEAVRHPKDMPIYFLGLMVVASTYRKWSRVNGQLIR